MSSGYPDEWNVPSSNSPGMNQPGKPDPMTQALAKALGKYKHPSPYSFGLRSTRSK